MNELVKDSVEKFIESLKNDQKVRDMLNKISEDVRNEKVSDSALAKEIVKIAKSKGYTFTENDIFNYFKETASSLALLTDEDLKKASGGVGENMSFGQKLAASAAGLGLGIGGAGLAFNVLGGSSGKNAPKVQQQKSVEETSSKTPKTADKFKKFASEKTTLDDYSSFNTDTSPKYSNKNSARKLSSGGGYGGYGGYKGSNLKNSRRASPSRFSRGYSFSPSSFDASEYGDFSNSLRQGANSLSQANQSDIQNMLDNAIEKILPELEAKVKSEGYNINRDELKKRLIAAVQSGNIKTEEDLFREITKGLKKAEKAGASSQQEEEKTFTDSGSKKGEEKININETEETKKSVEILEGKGKIKYYSVAKADEENKEVKVENKKVNEEKTQNAQLNGTIAFISKDAIDNENANELISSLREKTKDLKAVFIVNTATAKKEAKDATQLELGNLPESTKQIEVTDKNITKDNVAAVISLDDETTKFFTQNEEKIGELKVLETKKTGNKETNAQKETVETLSEKIKNFKNLVSKAKGTLAGQNLIYDVKENKDLHVLVISNDDIDFGKEAQATVNKYVTGQANESANTNIIIINDTRDEKRYENLLKNGWVEASDGRWFKLFRESNSLKKSVVLVKKDTEAEKLQKDTNVIDKLELINPQTLKK